MSHLLPFFVLILIVLGCAPSNSTRQKEEISGVFAQSNQSSLYKKIQTSIKMKKKWDSVEITKLENNAITIHLNYKTMPSNMTEVDMDTNGIAQTVLDLLVSEGYDPKKNWLALFVHAQRHERGASGSGVVRRFGKTSYDFNNDSLTFSQAGSFY